MTKLLGSILLASTLLAVPACYSDEPDAQYPGEVDDGSGDLVEVSPGVEVVADWDEPVFFVDNFYWVNRGGFWYRSGWYRGGWVRADVVPEHVRGIAHPEGYAHYRPAGWARHEPIRGGYASHAQYHATHASGGVHVRAAVHGGARRR
ncbi:MAG TPA: hypothetical protein VLX92_33730 [Kofleriaceae bacterium]|nr:hypothetical protein [Kofleriaceae bacterium]